MLKLRKQLVVSYVNLAFLPMAKACYAQHNSMNVLKLRLPAKVFPRKILWKNELSIFF
jgi:regulator of sigma D